MQYSKALKVTSGTTESDYDSVKLRVTPLVLSRIRVYFPAGCNGLVHVSFWQGGHRFAPILPGGWFRGNDGAIDVDEYFELWKGTRNIEIRAYNEDEIYDHEVLINLTILPEWAINPRQLGVAFVNSVKNFIKRLAGR